MAVNRISATIRTFLGRRRIACAALALVAALAGPGAARADGLFAAVSEAEARVATGQGPKLGPEAIRSRLVRIDSAELARHVAPLGIDGRSDRVDRARDLDGVIGIELFPGVAAVFRREDVDTIGDRGFAWTGEVAGRPFSAATLIIEGGQITGHVQLFRRLFRIDPLGNGIHRVTELDASKFPREGEARGRGAPPPRKADQGGRAVTTVVIDVLIAYTNEARDESGGNIVNEAKLAVSLANTGFRTTRIGIKLNIAKIMRTGRYLEATGVEEFERELDDVSGNNGSVLNQVRTARDIYNADMVTLFRSSGQYCGLGYYVQEPGVGTEGTGYSVVGRNCVSNLSYHHELGHNLGLLHDRYVHDPAPTSQYNFGYVNTDCQIRTVMAYNNACADRGFNCTRINFFSNVRFEDEDHPGCLLGINVDDPLDGGGAINSRRLRETKAAVSNYR